MLGRAFLAVGILFVALLAFAFYQDFNRPYVPIQQQYAARYGADFSVGDIQQLFPKVQVNGNFQVERCITCHVPDAVKIGPQEAARRLGANHPAVINDAVFAKYGQDTLICRPASAAAAAGASPSPAAAPSAAASGSPAASPSTSPRGSSPGASPVPSSSPTPSLSQGAGGAAAPLQCQDPKATPYYVLDVNGHAVTDPATGKPEVAQLTGFLPSQYKGLGIDETGCVICHNGNRQATTEAGAHQNLVPNPFAVYQNAPQLYENSCAQCHGATGEGLKGPPLDDQNRLGFFNDDYYHRCIFAGNLGSEHLGSIMPPWGLKHLMSNSQIDLLVHWIRLWQQYTSLP